jgi:hypothetical protein
MTERLMPLEKVRAISDPIERARVAEKQRLAAIDLAGDYAEIRAKAAAELRAQGLSFGQIGQAFGTTRERARQLAVKGASEDA